MWFVYILETRAGTLYTGITNNLSQRMIDHKKGRGARFTRSFGFRKLLYNRRCLTKSTALKRESQIKKMTRREKILLIAAYQDSKES